MSDNTCKPTTRHPDTYTTTISYKPSLPSNLNDNQEHMSTGRAIACAVSEIVLASTALTITEEKQ